MERELSRRDFLKFAGATVAIIGLSHLDKKTGGLLSRNLSPREQTAEAAEFQPSNPHFQRNWERTDKPVFDSVVNRTWMWGPAFTGQLVEDYRQGESPNGKRIVQYFDKSRMEITNASSGDPNSIWYVTNGLLPVELISGRMQTGDNATQDSIYKGPAEINVAGDSDDPNGPTYKSFQNHLGNEQQSPAGYINTKRINRDGSVTNDPLLAARNVENTAYRPETGHNIAKPFWDFMNSTGEVYENGQMTDGRLFQTPEYATGLPISEPYWANVKIGGQEKEVLMQVFERRVLTYTPDNPTGWQVEAGNVGLHYYNWRYEQEPNCEPSFPERLGNVETDGIEIYNQGCESGVVNGTGNNNFADILQVKNQYYPNDKFRFLLYTDPADVPLGTGPTQGVAREIDLTNIGGDKQVHHIAQKNGIWEVHTSIQTHEVSGTQDILNEFITVYVGQRIALKDQSGSWPADFLKDYFPLFEDEANTALRIVYTKDSK